MPPKEGSSADEIKNIIQQTLKTCTPLDYIPKDRREHAELAISMVVSESICAKLSPANPQRELPTLVTLKKTMHDTFLKINLATTTPYDVRNLNAYAEAILKLLEGK